MRRTISTGFDPVYYMVFHPSEILEVRRLLPTWKLKLGAEFEVAELSMAKLIPRLIQEDPLYEINLDNENNSDTTVQDINETLRGSLGVGADGQPEAEAPVLEAFSEALTKAKELTNGVLLITDVEAIHPYIRIGAIEQVLQGKFECPVIVFYPGVRTGKFGLKFLGIYPDDGNYRSVHVGG
ncbi:MAG: DUF1788 domain-containing protein [Akkermansiaceae bacterium]|nr:DUF1788 domain-containing protein [Akkermansiaceae bacterium]